jgi:cell wall-associated NlpC family hydrolase
LNPRRAAVIAAAESWRSTPFHHAAKVKGAGVDCLRFLEATYLEAGIVDKIDIPYYPSDWHLHRDAERYMEGLLQYAREIEGPPLPGDVALFRFGRCYSHGAIVVAWPRLIHAYWSLGVVWGSAELVPLRGRPVRFFSPFEAA